ncbi:MAG: 16S rRNA (adenine(1518)-N(6)/adenine(1519)-N(6))-dimethyltransferase RsmA [Planctomycetota bacterium]
MSQRQTVSYLIERFREAGIQPDTRRGQNFLIDLNLLSLLARAAQLGEKDVVLEVGTGLGALTGLLAPRAGAVVSVELSRELHQLASEELVEFPNVTLLQCDALQNKNHFNSQVLETVSRHMGAGPGRRLKLVANLPYCIATPVISNLLLTDLPPHSMTVTIQKELADRMTARPRTKAYGALSVWIQSQCEIRMKRVLPPAVFWPRPQVHSAIIQLVVDPRKRDLIPDLPFLLTFLRAVFTHRRKFLRSGLVGAYKKVLGKSKIDDLLSELEFGPRARAEELQVSDLLALSEKIRQTVSGSV